MSQTDVRRSLLRERRVLARAPEPAAFGVVVIAAELAGILGAGVAVVLPSGRAPRGLASSRPFGLESSSHGAPRFSVTSLD
jgi:hypothetical protein